MKGEKEWINQNKPDYWMVVFVDFTDDRSANWKDGVSPNSRDPLLGTVWGHWRRPGRIALCDRQEQENEIYGRGIDLSGAYRVWIIVLCGELQSDKEPVKRPWERIPSVRVIPISVEVLPSWSSKPTRITKLHDADI
jgi:hypothetical protein